MIFEYAELSCTEIINSQRVAAYAKLCCIPVECDACPELACNLDEDPYTDPATDEAPWYDEAVPESADVLGFMGLDVTGFHNSTFSRDPIPLIGDGSALGIGRRSHRTITYTVMMVVCGDECALSYGIGWLASVLSAGCCDTGCTGDTLSVYACCPTCDDCTGLRYLYDVALLEGPTIESLEYLNEGILARITYTLIAAKPWIFREPLEQSEEWVDLADGELVTLDPDDVYDECEDLASCLEDPLCPTPPLPARVPIPVDECYPSGSAQFRRTVISVSSMDVPENLDLVPVLEVETGSLDMRRLIVRFRASTTGTDCTGPQDPCSVCADIQVPFIPSSALLTVDGRVQRAEVECIQEPLGSTTARPTVYGREGRAFTWPAFQCPTGLCIEILTLASSTAPDARARVLLVSRSDAG